MDIFEDTSHRSSKQLLILVVHGHHNEEFCVTGFLEELLPQSKFLLDKLRGIASSSRVSFPSRNPLVLSYQTEKTICRNKPHVRKFALAL